MTLKELHIISVGNSLLTNFQKRGKLIEGLNYSNLSMGSATWKNYLDNRVFMNEIYSFLCENPSQNSAELNSFLSFCQKRKLKGTCEIFLFGTKTFSNEIVLTTLKRYFMDNEYALIQEESFDGYFKKRGHEERAKGFVDDLVLAFKFLVNLASNKKQKGYEVYFNPTGGFKAHVIVCALAGFITGSEVYYIHEEFKEVIKFPHLLYFPERGYELLFLATFFSNKDEFSFSLHHFESIEEFFLKLEKFGLVKINFKGNDSVNVKLTPYGRNILSYFGIK